MQWNEPPKMDTGAPMPEVKVIGNALFCSYICSNPDFLGWDSGADAEHCGFEEYCAVIKFSGLQNYKFGEPSDEGLHNHSLYNLGVRNYSFYKLEESPELKLYSGQSLWVGAFHDETLQVIAESAEVVKSRVNTCEPSEALANVTNQV